MVSEAVVLKWQERLQRQAQSGKSVLQFCVDEGITRSNFYAWRNRSEPDLAFVPMRVQTPSVTMPAQTPNHTDEHRFTLEHSALCWRGSELPNPQWLASLLKALRP
jgi:hypothetical protein